MASGESLSYIGFPSNFAHISFCKVIRTCISNLVLRGREREKIYWLQSQVETHKMDNANIWEGVCFNADERD